MAIGRRLLDDPREEYGEQGDAPDAHAVHGVRESRSTLQTLPVESIISIVARRSVDRYRRALLASARPAAMASTCADPAMPRRPDTLFPGNTDAL